MISPFFSRCSILAETAGDERKTSFAISFTGVRAFFLKHFDDLPVDVVEFVFPCRMSPFDEKMSFVTGTELRREVD